MPPLNHSKKLGRERRAEYIRLRIEGVNMVDAGYGVGAEDPSTIQRYERWFRAEHPEIASTPDPNRQLGWTHQ